MGAAGSGAIEVVMKHEETGRGGRRAKQMGGSRGGDDVPEPAAHAAAHAAAKKGLEYIKWIAAAGRQVAGRGGVGCRGRVWHSHGSQSGSLKACI